MKREEYVVRLHNDREQVDVQIARNPNRPSSKIRKVGGLVRYVNPPEPTLKDHVFGVVIDRATSPNAAAFKAGISYCEETIEALLDVVEAYLEQIDWDRNRLMRDGEVLQDRGATIDRLFKLLSHLRLSGTQMEDLGTDLEAEWKKAQEQSDDE